MFCSFRLVRGVFYNSSNSQSCIKSLNVIFSVNSDIVRYFFFLSWFNYLIINVCNISYISYFIGTIFWVFKQLWTRISKITKRSCAFPMCGSSYTVGPQTYIPMFSLSYWNKLFFFIVLDCLLKKYPCSVILRIIPYLLICESN